MFSYIGRTSNCLFLFILNCMVWYGTLDRNDSNIYDGAVMFIWEYFTTPNPNHNVRYFEESKRMGPVKWGGRKKVFPTGDV